MQKQRFFPNNLRLESSGPASNRERCQHPDAFFFRKEMTKRKSGLYMLLFLIFLSALSAYLPAASSTNTRWDLQRAGRCRSTRGALRTCHFCRLGSSGDAVHTQIPAGLRADSEPFPSFPRGRSVWEPPQLRRLCPLFRVVLCPARPMRGGCLSCQARCQAGETQWEQKAFVLYSRSRRVSFSVFFNHLGRVFASLEKSALLPFWRNGNGCPARGRWGSIENG